EYLRIARTREFNGRKLLDGTLGELTLQAGYGVEGGIRFSIGGAVADGNFSEADVIDLGGGSPEAVTTANFDGDGFTDLAIANLSGDTVSVMRGKGDGSFDAATTLVTGDTPR